MNNEKIHKTLINLINTELEAHLFYLQAAAWAVSHNLQGCYNFLIKQANEELSHMHKVFNYLNEQGNKVTFSALQEQKIPVKDIKSLFQLIAEREFSVTQAYDKALEQTLSEKDNATFSFLQWFINEQHEENSLFRSILAEIDLIGEGPNSRYLIDQAIGKMADVKKS
ncbi:Nonheme iron-containing ferritin [Liberibacter crescens BT-1]|uniref:Nonheme iron-containing ferritin n=1 Tax=Liberibacter crescens (strain BT-1) TaxID=1215343 RepID=L0EX80_LIBCB|nr:ferritin [Liberibacter crescens]AGA65268.1 Nonheme iron-containing ferritin [Liberibacter crescens BT-1]AMC13204.1 ferroxidase [Liberibacter crescens]